jgi:hypothetical protein
MRLVYLPGGVFPNYRNLLTGNQQSATNAPSIQPMASASTPAPAAPSSAPRKIINNPRLLSREQPQHAGQNINRLSHEQIASMFLPAQPTGGPIQQMPPRQQSVQPIQRQTTQPIQQQTVQQVPTGLRTLDNRLAHQNVNQVVPEHLVHTIQPDQSVTSPSHS